MTNPEFSNAFTVLLNSYANSDNKETGIILDEYEKSLFLTQAQNAITIELYSGKNPHGDSFESTEEMRRYLDALVKDAECSLVSASELISPKSYIYQLPEDLHFITLEKATFAEDALECPSFTTDISVYPVTHDEYMRIKDNPFRGPSRYKVIRLDCGDNKVEIISKYNVSKYSIKYLAKPEPIILEDLPDGLTIEGRVTSNPCKLNSALHDVILRRAVLLAIASKRKSN